MIYRMIQGRVEDLSFLSHMEREPSMGGIFIVMESVIS